MNEKDILKRILRGSLLLCERVGLDTGERERINTSEKRINTSEKRIVLIFAGAGKRIDWTSEGAGKSFLIYFNFPRFLISFFILL